MELFANNEMLPTAMLLVAIIGLHFTARAERRKELRDLRAELRDFREELRDFQKELRDLRAETLRLFGEAGKRREEGEKGIKKDLGDRITRLSTSLGHRIDRLEDRVAANHKELTEGLTETKTAVAGLSGRLEERAYLHRPGGGVLAGGAEFPAQGASVRERPKGYSGEPTAGSEKSEPLDGQRDDGGQPDTETKPPDET